MNKKHMLHKLGLLKLQDQTMEYETDWSELGTKLGFHSFLQMSEIPKTWPLKVGLLQLLPKVLTHGGYEYNKSLS